MSVTNTREQRPSLETYSSSASQEISHIYGIQRFLIVLQQPATFLCPESR
jgi:hypothetical protein